MTEEKSNIIELDQLKDHLDSINEKYIIKYQGRTIGEFLPPENTINIRELCSWHVTFCIPYYQRGYKWSENEVNALLDDINEFVPNNGTNKYCLQPLILQRDSNKNEIYNVIDGQQRLTTIYLIMMYFNEAVQFKIKYESRDKSEDFLNNIKLKINDYSCPDNIDFLHFKNNYRSINEYFKNLDENKKEIWKQKFLNNTYFIKYFINEVKVEDAIKAFTNTNSRKVPLTDAEIFKGLLLQKKNYLEDERAKVISEISEGWNKIEERLNEPNFYAWLGLSKRNEDKPHIDIVLKLAFNDSKNKNFLESFKCQLSSHKNDIKSIDEVNFAFKSWLKIKNCFLTIEKAYLDIDLYNLIGFLVYSKTNTISFEKLYLAYKNFIEKNLENKKSIEYKNLGKNFLVNLIKNTTLKNVKFDDDSQLDYDKNKLKLTDLDYDKDKPLIYDLLFLYNVILYINDKSKINFAEFSKYSYEIEHIYPHSDKYKYDKLIKEWWDNIKNDEFCKDKIYNSSDESIKNILNKESINQEEASAIYSTIFNENHKPLINSIGNLCLLDSKTNISFTNYPFCIKRKLLLDNKNHTYILKGTMNAFLGQHNDYKLINGNWDKTNYDAYLEKINEVLEKYFGEEKQNG